MGKFWDIVRGGSKEERERKAMEEAAFKKGQQQAFYSGRIEGRLKAAKAAGRKKGKEEFERSQRGTLGNLFVGFQKGAKAFEAGAGALTGDVDLGNIGKGLTFAGFGGEPKKKKRKARKKVVTYY